VLGDYPWCDFGTTDRMALNVRLTSEAERVLAELAESEGISKNDLVNRAVLDHGSRVLREREVRELARRAIADYRPLLDRLAQ
jgi:uncharacterized protein (DUF1778 family)